MKKIYKILIGLTILIILIGFTFFLATIYKQQKNLNLEKKINNKEIVDTTKKVIQKEKPNEICLDVPDQLLKRIESGVNTKGITLRNAKAVKSKDFKGTYFISADMQGPGFEGKEDFVTFSVNSLEGNTMILSSGNVSDDFFDWPMPEYRLDLDGAYESRECLTNSN
jgi:hypothetical protein